jgi:hypothetical protein
MFEEATDPVPAKASEEDLRTPHANYIIEKKITETAPITKHEYHIE